jgi:hypothetical protein
MKPILLLAAALLVGAPFLVAHPADAYVCVYDPVFNVLTCAECPTSPDSPDCAGGATGCNFEGRFWVCQAQRPLLP